MDDVDALVFDLYGTLLEVASVRRAAAEVAPDPIRMVDLWRQKQLEYTWLRSLMGQHRDFWKITRDAMDFTIEQLGLTVDIPARARLLNAWLDVKPYPEVPGALAALAPRRLAVLSNGSPDMLAAGLVAAGLERLIDPVLSVEEVGVFKPHPTVYDLVPTALDLPIDRILFVSSNPWDVSGAKAFGLSVAWVNRRGAKFDRLGQEPDLVVRNLNELVRTVTGSA